MRSYVEQAVRSLLFKVCISSLAVATGCSSDVESADTDAAEAADFGAQGAALLQEEPTSYPRYVDAKGAFTCDLTLVGNYPQSQVPPDLERDRMVMTRQPGLLVKYLPLAFDPVNTTEGQPNLFSGGRYLFKNANKAANYRNFVVNTFALDGVQFLDREIFLDSECHDYAVVKAYEFTPLHDTHVLVRTERFAMTGDKPVKKLKALWPQLLQEAGDGGMAAVWLIYNEAESIASVVYLHDRVVPYDPSAPDFASLAQLASAPALGHLLEELGWARTFDRTHWILTIWHPFVDGDLGEPSDWPHSPPFPAPSCGDGVCQVSRGEAENNCPGDCPAQCGNGKCQPNKGENDYNCPGDCGG